MGFIVIIHLTSFCHKNRLTITYVCISYVLHLCTSAVFAHSVNLIGHLHASAGQRQQLLFYILMESRFIVFKSMESPFKDICEKITFQTLIFAKMLETMNRKTCKLIKNLLIYVQTKNKGEINNITTRNNCILILYTVKSLKVRFLLIPELFFTIK